MQVSLPIRWRQRLFEASAILLILSACALAIDASVFHYWPRKHPVAWIVCVTVAQVGAYGGFWLALAGKGWQRLLFAGAAILQIWATWNLSTIA
jgi:hypothetical protein